MSEVEAGFRATVEHAARLSAKARMLLDQARDAIAVAASLGEDTEVSIVVLEQMANFATEHAVPDRALLRKALQARLRAPTATGVVIRRQRNARTPWPVAPAFVYLLLAEDCSVLYVGFTENPANRMAGHRAKPYTAVDLIACRSVDQAKTLEGDLIFQHQPPLNKADRSKRRHVRVA